MEQGRKETKMDNIDMMALIEREIERQMDAPARRTTEWFRWR